MPVKADMNLVGVRETIRSLNKIEPGLRKQFVNDSRRIAAPAIEEARRGYDRLPLSGMARRWSQNGRQLFPFSLTRAQRGVQLKVDTDRRATAIISIVQKDQAAAIFETAGRRTPNPFERSLGDLQPGRTRVLGPAVYRSRRYFEPELRKSIARLTARVQKELN